MARAIELVNRLDIRVQSYLITNGDFACKTGGVHIQPLATLPNGQFSAKEQFQVIDCKLAIPANDLILSPDVWHAAYLAGLNG